MDIVDILENVFDAKDEWEAARERDRNCNYDPHGGVKQEMIDAKQNYKDKLSIFIERIKNDTE